MLSFPSAVSTGQFSPVKAGPGPVCPGTDPCALSTDAPKAGPGPVCPGRQAALDRFNVRKSCTLGYGFSSADRDFHCWFRRLYLAPDHPASPGRQEAVAVVCLLRPMGVYCDAGSVRTLDGQPRLYYEAFWWIEAVEVALIVAAVREFSENFSGLMAGMGECLMVFALQIGLSDLQVLKGHLRGWRGRANCMSAGRPTPERSISVA